MIICVKNFLFIFCFVLVNFLTSANASQTTQAFLDGIKYYKAGDFDSAISEFNKIADVGINNGKLYYNLGNSYLKKGDLGHAVLWYERAIKLIPDDPDLKFNYKYSLSLIKDEKGDKTGPIIKIIFFWNYVFSNKIIQYLAIILNIIFWTLLSIQILKRKKLFKTPEYISFILAIIFTLTAFYNYYESNIKKGVILPPQISVRSGLTNESTELFVLHAGTKIKIQKEKQNFYRIYFSDGKIGWIKKSEAGVI